MWLGRPAEALEMLDSALAGTTRPVRRALLHEDLMNVGVALEDPDRACASAHSALDESDEHELGVFPPKIRKARAGFPPQWRPLALVRELDERLFAVA